MLWLFFALLAPALWAITNIIDDELIDSHTGTPAVLVTITGFFAIIPFFIALFSGSMEWPGYTVLFFSIMSGVIGLLVYFPYFFALKISDPAPAMLMWNLTPAFVVGASILFFGIHPSFVEYVAIGILIVSSLIVGYKKGSRFDVNKAFPWMFFASILSAVEIVCTKVVFNHTSFLTGLGWISLAIFLTALVLFMSSYSIRQRLRQHSKGLWKEITIDELLDSGAQVARNYAISAGPIVLVKAAEGLQPLFVLFFSLFMVHKRSSVPVTRLIIAAVIAIVGLLFMRSFE